MKKILSILLLVLILLSNVSCNKDTTPTDPTVPPETSGTTEAPLPPVDPLLEEYAFVLTDDFRESYRWIYTERDEIFQQIKKLKDGEIPGFIPFNDDFFHCLCYTKTPVVVFVTDSYHERYAYCTGKENFDGVNYSRRISFDHTKSVVDINEFEVKELVEQPNEDLRQCPNQQTGYYVLEDTIYYYYENGNLQFIRWVYKNTQMTIEVLADTEGYGFQTYKYLDLCNKSKAKPTWDFLISLILWL